MTTGRQVLLSVDLDGRGLQDLVDRLPIDGTAYQIVDNPAEVRFEWFSGILALPVQETERGRIFQQSGELRWRRLNSGQWRAVYLGQQVDLPDLAEHTGELDGLLREEFSFVLWGLRTARTEFPANGSGILAEERVPRYLAYPWVGELVAGERLSILAERWLSEDGRPLFLRYVGVTTTKGEEEDNAQG